jgi:hypothetical protein
MPREAAIEAAGWLLGDALSDMNGASIDTLVCDGIEIAGLSVYPELEYLDSLPEEANVAAQAGFAVAALLAGYSDRIGLGLTRKDCTIFARSAVRGATHRLTWKDDGSPCADCGAKTQRQEPGARSEWYMVHDEVWTAAGMEETGGYLCIGCLEKRLGRRLVPADFAPLSINDLRWGGKSDRLVSRLTGQPDGP